MHQSEGPQDMQGHGVGCHFALRAAILRPHLSYSIHGYKTLDELLPQSAESPTS
jgi:hypothetical protein